MISSPLSTLISLRRDEAPSGVAGAPEGGDLSSSGSTLADKRKRLRHCDGVNEINQDH